MKKISISKIEYVEMATDDEPGYPAFKIAGTADGACFEGEVAMEIDGRDAEYECESGPITISDCDEMQQIYEQVWGSAPWKHALVLHGHG